MVTELCTPGTEVFMRAYGLMVRCKERDHLSGLMDENTKANFKKEKDMVKEIIMTLRASNMSVVGFVIIR